MRTFQRLTFDLKSSPRRLEGRDLPLELCGLKLASTGSASDPITFSGYGSVWGRVDAYGDTMVKGAFARALKTRMPMMLYSHNRARVPGKYTSAAEDGTGLKLTGELTPGHSDAADLGASLKHGSLTGLSIGGYTNESEPNAGGGRNITEFDLYEVSPVAMPADDCARIDLTSVKSLIDQCERPQDFESILREAGFSKSDATAFVARMRRTLRGEPGSADASNALELVQLMRDFTLPASLLTTG